MKRPDIERRWHGRMRWLWQHDPQEKLRVLLLFLFIALLLVVPWAHWGVPLLGLTLLVPCTVGIQLFIAKRRLAGRTPASLERDDWLWVLVLLAYGGLWLLDVLRSGHWPLDSPEGRSHFRSGRRWQGCC